MIKFFSNLKVIHIKKENIEGILGAIFKYGSIVSSPDQEGTKDVNATAVSFGLTTGSECFVSKHFAVLGDIITGYALSAHKKRIY